MTGNNPLHKSSERLKQPPHKRHNHHHHLSTTTVSITTTIITKTFTKGHSIIQSCVAQRQVDEQLVASYKLGSLAYSHHQNPAMPPLSWERPMGCQ